MATATGERAIETLHVGDTVLAEDPTTGKVERERVEAVWTDPVLPLVAVDLLDGSTIKVTSDHPDGRQVELPVATTNVAGAAGAVIAKRDRIRRPF